MQLLPYTDSPFQIQFSFYQLIENLEKIAEGTEESARARQLLEELRPHPELRDSITDISQIEDNSALIHKLLGQFFPEILTNNEIKAISFPYRNFVFNHTERFKNILRAAGPAFEFNIRGFDEHQFYVLSCCLILNEHYGTKLDFSKPLFYDIPTADGITRHYRILYNADFLDIIPTGKSLKLSPGEIDQLMNNYDDLDLWKAKFPRESWIIKGFAIMTLYDATIENAVSILKEKLLGLGTTGFQLSVETIFQSIYRIPDIGIGFTLFNQDENKFKTASFNQKMKSFILPDEDQREGRDILCTDSYRSLMKYKTYFSVSDNASFLAANPESHLARIFSTKNIQSFILAPVIKNGVFFGILEVVSARAGELNSVNANKLEVVMPFLTDTIERLVSAFQNQVRAVIQDNYTTIHPSVYWKFKAEAEKFIETRQQDKTYTLNEVVFRDVFPLYGQVDIKGSSDVRNLSVQKDLQNQLGVLLNLLEKLNTVDSYHEELEQVVGFTEQLQTSVQANTEQYIINYLDGGLHLRLKKITAPEWMSYVNTYFLETHKTTGSFYTFRRKYERTISLINEKMAYIIDTRQLEAQATFPHYYERFKTDGVEHNLYIGHSISPARIFNIENLHELRLWQMYVLCEMEIAHHHLKPTLPYQLDVTTLILVYHSTIAIRFRMDEKRFDVDGTYNARFEVVKKRIDKACIKDSDERITESGKITIVYSSDAEEQEYDGYISSLQERHLLGNFIEKFDVEDLQGVSGLKALRVKILFPEL
jgi:hypothetical protein